MANALLAASSAVIAAQYWQCMLTLKRYNVHHIITQTTSLRTSAALMPYLLCASVPASPCHFGRMQVGQVGTCPRNLQPASRLASYKRLPSDEAAMYEALKKAPIAVELTIDDGLFAYTGGVYSSSTCSGPVNHAAVIIGAGVFPDTNEPYWLLRMR
jgi:hypothetical protein